MPFQRLHRTELASPLSGCAFKCSVAAVRAEESPASQRRHPRARVGPRVLVSSCTEHAVRRPSSVQWGLLIVARFWGQEFRHLSEHPVPRGFRELAVETLNGAGVSQSPTGLKLLLSLACVAGGGSSLLSGGRRVAFLSIFVAECPHRLATAFPRK